MNGHGHWPYATAGGVVPVAIPSQTGVTGTVTDPVTDTVTPLVTEPVTGTVTPGVTEAAPDNAEEGGTWNLGFDGTGWTEALPDEPPAPIAGPLLARLLELFRSSEFLGGGPGGLLDELAHPRPESMAQHLRHVAALPFRPAGPAASAAFIGGHLIVTVPVKGTGKTLIRAGTALIRAGTLIDWAGDRFSRLVAIAGIITLLAVPALYVFR